MRVRVHVCTSMASAHFLAKVKNLELVLDCRLNVNKLLLIK